ncbi:MAG TPA: MMPL family transporter, partial [Casimicrobiaceae bacterium]
MRTALALALVLAAAAAYLATAMRVDRDFAAFLPQGGDADQRFFTRQLRDSPAARLVLMRIGGADAATLATASETLRAALAADPDFDYASNGSLASGLADLPVLHAARYVLAPDAATHMSVDALRVALRQRYAALGSNMAMLEKRFVADDPTGETLALLGRLQSAASLRRERGVWFDADGTHAMLVAQTRAPASDTRAQHAAGRALDAAFARSRGAAALRIEYSSPGFMAAASEASIARDAARVSWIATLGIIVILCLVYRSLPIVALCALPAAAGLVAGLCMVTATFGSVHAITVAFGTTLIGEAVDYPSYVLTRLRAARTVAGVQRELRRPFVLAVLTTACGSLAFLASGVDGLVQLGVLTSSGIVVSGAVAWWIVPGLASSQWRFRALASRPGAGWPRARRVWRLAALVAVTLALLALAFGKPPWNDDPARMSPLPPQAIALDQSLRRAAGAPDASRFALLRGIDVEDVLQRTERLRTTLDAAVAAGELAGYDDAARYLPSAATQRARVAALPDASTLRERLAQAMAGSPFRTDAFAPFLHDVAAARASPPLTAVAFAGTGIG